MEKIFEKIADHFNNPEMADRVLCVKVRADGWEKLEAASLLRHIRSKTKPSVSDDNDAETKTGLENEELCSDFITVPSPKSAVLFSQAGEMKTQDKEKISETRTVGPENSSNVLETLKPKLAKCKKQESFSCTKDETIGEQKKDGQQKSPASLNTKENLENDQLAKSDFTSSEKGKAKETVSVLDKSETVLCENEATKSLLSNHHTTENVSTRESNGIISSGEEFLEGVLVDPVGSKVEDDLSSTVIKEYEIHVHSFWLSLNSSFFGSLFYSSGMKETKDNQVVINVSESLSKMFLLLLESLYKPDVVNSQSVENLLMLMRLAHVYDVERTLKSCQNLLSSSELTVQICDKALNMLDHERLQEMDHFINRCEQFLVKFFSPLDHHWNSEELISLSSIALQKVIGSDDLCLTSENVAFQSLIKWAEVNEVFGESLQPLLELVRFHNITINYLHDMVTSDHPIASTVPSFRHLFEDAVFFHAFSEERRECDDENFCHCSRKLLDEAILFNWKVELQENMEFPDKKKKMVKSPHFWVSGYEMHLELKLRPTGNQGLYLTICQSDFINPGKCFVKLKYSLSSNMLKATHVFDEEDIFDREGAGWGYEEFFPLSWEEFKEHTKRTPLIITAQVRLLE